MKRESIQLCRIVHSRYLSNEQHNSPFMNEVERSEFPIESAYGDRFRFRFLRHSSRGDRVVRMRLVQLLEVRHFSTLSPSEEKHKFSISHVLHEITLTIHETL